MNVSKNSKNNIANRRATVIELCNTCHEEKKPHCVIKEGKKRMIKICGCGFIIDNPADIHFPLK